MDYKWIDFPIIGQYFFNLWNKDRVGRHENLFILFLKTMKITGSAQKYRVGRVSGNTAIFLFGLSMMRLNFAMQYSSRSTVLCDFILECGRC